MPRVDEGILRLEGHLKLIVAANGRMVPDIELKRQDRRKICADGKFSLGQFRMTKARKRGRKAAIPNKFMLYPRLADAEKHFFVLAISRKHPGKKPVFACSDGLDRAPISGIPATSSMILAFN